MYALTWLIKLNRWLYLIYKHETLEYVRQITVCKDKPWHILFPFLYSNVWHCLVFISELKA